MPLDSLRSRQHQATLTCFWSTFLPATAITVQLEDVSGEFCTWNIVEPTEWPEPRFHFFDILGTVHSAAKGEVHGCACIKQHGCARTFETFGYLRGQSTNMKRRNVPYTCRCDTDLLVYRLITTSISGQIFAHINGPLWSFGSLQVGFNYSSDIFGPIRENVQRPPKGTWRQ